MRIETDMAPDDACEDENMQWIENVRLFGEAGD